MDAVYCHGALGFSLHASSAAEEPSGHRMRQYMLETHTHIQTVTPIIRQAQETRCWETLSIEDMLFSLDHSHTILSVDSFICTLRKCRESRSLPHANHTLLHIHNNGLEANCALGNHVVPLFVECGGFSDAQRMFSKLAYPNEHSWTSLIQGCIECGEYEHALELYQRMQENSIASSKHTFVAILKACSRLRYIDRGQFIFSEIIKEEIEKDPFVGNILVDMYAKCGLLMEAHEVFHEVSTRNVVSWTALISGYVEHGFANEALHCFEQMQEEGVSPNVITFICILKACTGTGAADKGQEIHDIIAREGFETNVMVGNSLVDMYARCGFLTEAREVFDGLPIRDVITWTALMAGYAEHGLEEETLNLLEQMQLEGLLPNAITYVCALQACCSVGAIAKAQDIHTKIVEEGFETDPLIGSTLVDVYSSLELLVDAQDVFNELPAQDVVAWTALIAGYTENGLVEKVLICLDQMQIEGVLLDAFTIACSLRACSSLGAINRGRELHVHIIVEGFERDPFVGNSLVGLYAKCGLMVESREIFNELTVQDVVSWNALVTGYAELGCSEEALECLEMMESDGVFQDFITVISSLKVCASVKALCKGQEIHVEAVKVGFESDQLVSSLLVALYAKCGKLAEAEEMFEELTVRDVVSWTGLITGYADHGRAEDALRYLEHMQGDKVIPDVVAWSAVIAGFNNQGKSEKALALYAQMQEQGLLPNNVTLVSVLKACGKTVALDRGRRAHSLLYGIGFDDLTITAALVDMYSECGSIVDAQRVFDNVPTKDSVKWNALITGLARQGESELVFRMFDGMRQAGIQPDGITFLNALTVCSHVGLLDRGLQYFEDMTNDYRIMPVFKHYSCMIDLLSRAGQLGEAVSMLEAMPFQPDYVMWNTMLAACWKWGNLEIGRKAFEGAMNLGESNDAACALMSNIYSDAGMMEDVRKIEAMVVNL